MNNMDIREVVEDIGGGAFLLLIVGLVIYILLVVVNVLGSLPGGAVVRSTTHYGILVVGAFVTISGLVGLIKFAQWISTAFEGIGF